MILSHDEIVKRIATQAVKAKVDMEKFPGMKLVALMNWAKREDFESRKMANYIIREYLKSEDVPATGTGTDFEAKFELKTTKNGRRFWHKISPYHPFECFKVDHRDGELCIPINYPVGARLTITVENPEKA